MSNLEEPISREDFYLAYLNGENVELPEPVSRVDHYLYNLCVTGGTGGIETIKEEVSNLSSQLEHKANEVEVIKKGYANLNDFDEESRLALTGNDFNLNYVLGDDILKNNNIPDGEILARKLKNRKRTKNLFDCFKPNLYNGSVGSTGFTDNSSCRCFYIPINVNENTSITVSRELISSRFAVALSTQQPSDGGSINNFKANYDAKSLTINVTPNDKYLSVYFYISTNDTLTIQDYLRKIMVEYGSVATEFKEYYEINITENELTEDINNNLKIVSELKNELYKTSRNLFDLNNYNVINALFSSSLPITANSSARTFFINIDSTKNSNITVTKLVDTKNFRVGTTSTLPSEGVAINTFRGSITNSLTIPITENDKYLVIYVYNTTQDTTLNIEKIINSLMVEYGSIFTGYEKHNYLNILSKDSIRPFNSDFFLKSANEPIISIVNDGADNIEGLKNLKNLCDELNIKCTYALLTMYIEPTHARFKQEILDLYKAWQLEGFHITTEGETHEEYWKEDKLDLAKCEKDVINGLITLRNQGFLNYEYMVTPNSIATKEMQDMIRKWCKCSITGGSKANIGYHDGRFNIHRIFIRSDASGGIGLQGYKDIIDNTIDNCGWLVFGLHTSLSSEYDETLVRNVLEYAKSKNVRILPFNQAYSIKEPIYTFGEVYN